MRRGRHVDQLHAVAALAARQHAQVERSQLTALGVDRGRRARLERDGLLHPVHDGVWSWGAPNDQPLARAKAATLAGHPHGVLAEDGARWLWGWVERLALPATVLVPRGSRAPRDDVRFVQRLLPPAERTHQRGIPVTTPARTVVDCAPLLRADALDRLVADALTSPYLSLTALEAAVRTHAGRPGAPALREVLEVAEMGATRSKAEALLREAIVEAELDRPRFNVRVHGRERDAVWPDLRLVVEVQGWRFHSAPRQFEEDRRRDLELAAHGWQVHPVSYRMLRFHRVPTIARLAAVVALRAAELGR